MTLSSISSNPTRFRDSTSMAMYQESLTKKNAKTTDQTNLDSANASQTSSFVSGAQIPLKVERVPGDPAATIKAAREARIAAMMPPGLSPSDRTTALKASQVEYEAQRELAHKQAAEEIIYSSDGQKVLRNTDSILSLLG
ncbi:MAG: hypothetical protein HQM09_04160 [Candidatus Riflebacteria bacterium]|nr:hypothetical protein [Candidatus Riflebacteria bacterium]